MPESSPACAVEAGGCSLRRWPERKAVRIPAAAILFVASAGLGVAQEDSTLAARGAQAAAEHCARCHIVGSKNRFGGISSTPSFAFLVNYLDDWEDRFMSFHTRLPHPSVIRFRGEAVDPEAPTPTMTIELDYAEIDALTAYAATLVKQD